MNDTDLQWWDDGNRQYSKNSATIKRLQEENKRIRENLMRKALLDEYREPLIALLNERANEVW